MTKFYYIAILYGLMSLLGSPLSHGGDHQFRAGLTLKQQLNEDWKTVLDEQLRYKSQTRGLYYQGTDLGLVYSGLATWLDLGFKMKLAFQEDDVGHWLRETRPQWDTTLKHTIRGFAISDRSRLEYRVREDDSDVWRYRNKLKVQSPWELSCLALRPYASDELFFQLDGTGLSTHRISLGVTVPFTKRIKGDIFPFWQMGKSDNSWHEDMAFGFKLVIAH